MALVKRVGNVAAAAVEKEKVVLGDIVPQYEWQTSAGESRQGLKLHYISYLPERQDGEKAQPAQMSGFMDSLTDPVTGSVRGGRECVPLRVTGAAGIDLAKRMVGAIALAEGATKEEAIAAMAGFNPAAPLTVKTGSLFIDIRDNAEAEVLRDEDYDMVALYATNGALTGRMMYAPPFEFEEGFE